MKTKITGPEQFDRLTQVSNKKMWIILTSLTLIIVAGLILFFTHPLTITDRFVCIVKGEAMSCETAVINACTEIYDEKLSREIDIDYLLGLMSENYRKQQVLPVCLITNCESNVTEGMKLTVDGLDGEVISVSFSLNMNELMELGFPEDVLRKADVNPGQEYMTAYAVLHLQDHEVPETHITEAELIRDQISPISLILK